ncbi:MAG: hypothetical protein D6766_12005 [Verrucomicrobia bacterium]|nr:MAG: hypothetical protein D6766_12005 [Verrucomicrobiota bacterium]
MELQRKTNEGVRHPPDAGSAPTWRRWTRRAWLAGMGMALLAGGCDRLGGSRPDPDRVRPEGVPFSFRLPETWRVDEVEEFAVRLRVSRVVSDDSSSVVLEWTPIPEGQSIHSVSLAPSPELEDIQLVGSGNTTLGTWMARWRTYTYKGKKERMAQVNWVVHAPRLLIRSKLVCPESERSGMEKRLRRLMESIRIEDR